MYACVTTAVSKCVFFVEQIGVFFKDDLTESFKSTYAPITDDTVYTHSLLRAFLSSAGTLSVV